MKMFVGSEPVVVEAGAHVGIDTAAMARTWPKGEIHAFEPVPDLRKELERRASRHRNVRVYDAALAAESGTAAMHVSSGASDASSSLFPPAEHLKLHPATTFESKIAVPVLTLDEWAAMNSIRRVDLLWLDAQGGELDILRGGSRLLRTVRAIYSEVSLIENYAGGVLYSDLRQWLAERGFVPAIQRIAWSDGGNVLFARRGKSE